MADARRGALALAVAAAMVVSACARSELDPDADVTVTGVVVGQGNTAAAGVPVSLTRDPSAADVFGGLGIGGATLGLACAAEPRPRLCDDGIRRSETGGDGRFAFELKGRDTQDNLGFANEFSVEAILPAADGQLAGPLTSGRLLIQREQLDLGSLRSWNPSLDVTALPGAVRVSWSAPPPELGASGAAEAVFDAGAAGVVWSHPGTGTVAELDARLLEAANGGVAVAATAAGQAPGTDLTVTYRSPTLPYASAARPPLSRGRPCTISDPAGAQQTLSPCPLTDGRFLAPEHTGSQPTVDLGQQVEATLVAVRGCRDQCTVEVSGDGGGWFPLFTATTPFAAFVPPAGTAPRFVRLAADVDAMAITELSVFTGPPMTEPGLLAGIVPADIETAGGVYSGGDTTSGDDSGFPLAGVVAGVLLAGVVGGGGFWLGRRRPSLR